jgi:hypothetical protein
VVFEVVDESFANTYLETLPGTGIVIVSVQEAAATKSVAVAPEVAKVGEAPQPETV